ncbi:radical SAM family RiPP maturation amino acid epimerase [Sphaerospermopsis sp. FACHB-1094]|uniref:radical SAM family RiPP maturation amino acid epimerase n=1 Tax=Sphaerospermopsis sp. FACHB-1094 TaxID=2692861 RepID=UPI001689CB9F|nr:radical SAM family RiPP maturation amino acid epimerase [Sphaerospermopsis sp. FACHB-1094]MBD2131923.1 radical SAM family RiPP maturation amino acid epimerase [Sphaerospermopsis sp. FACHB-1094]
MNKISALTKPKRIEIDISQIRCLLEQGDSESHWLKNLSDQELTQEILKITQIKRFIEKGQGDLSFREKILSNFDETVKAFNLDVRADEVEFLWNPRSAKPPQGYQDFNNIQSQWAQSIINLAGSSSNLRYRAWRKRQVARCKSQVFQDETQHFPVSFELNKGCSVGCWFCGVAAPSLGDIFFYTAENAQLWQEILVLMKQTLGEAAGAGFCYCATDPLDNPDYEKFLSDFHAILGVFPQTTTAQPLKDPERTRSLLKLSLEKGCLLNRFSIISLKLLERLHAEFTPEELAFVGLVLQNPESGLPKSISGKARERAQRQAEKEDKTINDDHSGTTACVTGFLINMVDRSVKLISPCNASDRWPLGYQIYEQGNFSNPRDLGLFMEAAVDKHMQIEVKDSDNLRFRPDLQYESLSDGFQLSTRFFKHKFRHADHMKQLGEIILPGNKTVAEILHLFNIWGIPSGQIRKSINLMFSQGVFDDEPIT